MPSSHRSSFLFRPGLSLLLLGILLATLWLTGGASRAEVLGQVVVRTVSWIVLIVAILFGPRPSLNGAKPVLILLGLAAVLALVQLIPLPPAVWQSLPGRGSLAEAALASGQVQPWRPWSIVPGATFNAASSLVVPFATLLLLLQLKPDERLLLPALLLGFVTISMLVGLLQFSGAVLNNVFVNDTPGAVAGTFANRNHFALFLAIGCLLAPVWSFAGEKQPRWRTPVAWGLVLLFLLTILGSGSRAGLGVGLAAVLLGLLMSRKAMQRALARYPRWVFPAVIAGIVGIVALFVLLSFLSNRAVSIDRVFALDATQDMRSRGLPVVLGLLGDLFPFGAGLGSFDPIFRAYEPFDLLKPTYFNHAHNDFLEVMLDAGLPGLLLLVAAFGWWAWASVRAWWAGPHRRQALPRLGSAILFLVAIASIVDYPARTPMMMAVIMIAATWLSGHSQAEKSSALPKSD